jgi:metal-dependent amidase/aminoacylase/carboxypeptidase family protein
VIAGIESSFGVRITTELITGYPALSNDAECAATVARVAQRIVGEDRISTADLPMAGGEDFAYFCQETKGAYFFLGAKKPGENTPVCHHPDFDFDDDLIGLGMRMFLGIAADRAG